VVIEGEDMGHAVRLSEDEKVVGTERGCDLVLTDERVSGRHLTVQRTDGGFAVRDLRSKNGTIYEGSRIEAATVPLGATLKLGHTFVRIQPLPQAVEVAPSQSRRFGDLVAESLAMREVFAVLELAAPSDATVLLEGETGVGKELAARAIHDASRRRRGPFVAVDCSALPETLVESELFGHVRGAFTGATGTRKGAFLRADGGTLFLDELGSVPVAVQARLLRVIEERQVRPVGADAERDVDVRLIAASRADLSARVAEGTFRPDLFYRLSVVRVAIPPLRSRREDIAPIVAEMLVRRGVEPGTIEGPNLDLLFSHGWPGNVRELRNVVDRAVALSPDAECFADLRIEVPSRVDIEGGMSVRSDLSFTEAKQVVVEEFERRYLADVLARTNNNVSAAAREAGLDRKHLRMLARRYGLL
jgi:DNA-binding NtrC family response regulator